MMFLKNEVTLDQLRSYAPAIFAEYKGEDRSEKYRFVSTYDRIKLLMNNFDLKIVGVKQVNSRLPERRRTNKHKVYFALRSLDTASMLRGEEIPLFTYCNSHGGQSAEEFLAEMLRLACTNGLMFPVYKEEHIKVRHVGSSSQDVIDATYRVIESFPKKIEAVKHMKEITLNNDERYALAESASTLVFPEAQINLNKERGIDLPTRLLTVRRYEDKNPTLWNTFNTIQENVIKGGIRVLSTTESNKERYAKTRKVESIDRDKQLNQALMTLALKMREIKTGAAL